MKELKIAVCCLSVCLFGTAAAAGATVTRSDGPTVRTYKGVAYMTGAVSPNQREALEARAAADNLELHFALGGDEYLGQTRVSIEDVSGHAVLEATSKGPLLFTKLTPGNYVVTATTDGMSESRVMTVPRDGHVMAHFVWDESVRPGE